LGLVALAQVALARRQTTGPILFSLPLLQPEVEVAAIRPQPLVDLMAALVEALLNRPHLLREGRGIRHL
jgi:hypothetical protein